MKFFGEYLVEKKVISENSLLEALLWQSSQIPSLAEIAYQKNILSSAELIRILAFQTRKKVDFKAACEELGFWNAKLDTALEKELRHIRKPLGHILVQKGRLTFSSLLQHLETYFAGLRELTPEPALDFMSEGKFLNFPRIETSLFDEVKDAFQEDKKQAFLRSVEHDNLSTHSVDVFQTLKKDVSFLRSIMRCLQATLLHELFKSMESAIDKLIAKPKADFSLISQFLQEATLLAWRMKELILEHQSEKPFWDDADQRENFIQLIQKLKTFNG